MTEPISGIMKSLDFEKMAAGKFDPEKDRRVIGGEGFRRILCEFCEDEGNVYIAREKPNGVWYLFLARCTCTSPGAMPPRMWHKMKGCPPRLVADVPTWMSAFGGGSVEPEELIPMRLAVFFDLAIGRLDMEITAEPRRVKYRTDLTKSFWKKETNPAGEDVIVEDVLRW